MTYFYGKDIEFHKNEEKVVRILHLNIHGENKSLAYMSQMKIKLK
jgi:hypothetical protein